MATLEQAVRQAWIGWGLYAQWTRCDGCGAVKHCRARTRKRWLCLDCFDQAS